MLIDFYTPYLPAGCSIDYVHYAPDAPPPRWLLNESRAIHPEVPPSIGPYRLIAIYPYGGYSGWTWIVYERP